MSESRGVLRGRKLQRILTLRRNYWDNDGFDPDARHAFLRTSRCKTPALGGRLYASEKEERLFYNSCKSPACSSCGHRATLQWQRERWCALPEGRYFGITLTMPNTVWPLFAGNERLRHRLAEIAATVILNYAKVHYGIEVGVMPILHTFNGELLFKPHVHCLVTAQGLPDWGQRPKRRVLFHLGKLLRSWQRLIIALLRSASAVGALGIETASEEVERVLRAEETRNWIGDAQELHNKEDFIRYIGRYVRRPPISLRRIDAVSDEHVSFWFEDKRNGNRRTTVRCTLEEFIDRWAQHIPKYYRHGVRHFGLFAPRRWHLVGRAMFAMLGQPFRGRPKRRPWAASVEEEFGWNPRKDTSGERMKFVMHISPVVA